MKKQISVTQLLVAACFIIFAGCEKEKPHYTNTSFTLNTLEKIKAGYYIGSFTSTGDPTTSGSWTMVSVPLPGDSIHCTQTLTVPGKGSITAFTDCSLKTNLGGWYITEGTGAYANLQGNGKLVMTFPKDANSYEVWTGKTWRE